MATQTAEPKTAKTNGKSLSNGKDSSRDNNAGNGKEAVSGKIVSYPAHPRLATPTDLSPEAAKAVTEVINPLIADGFALYVKTKNFHWHLSGPHFRSYHLMFDEQAEEILESIDPLAERLRKIGGTTLRSISHIAQTQTILDDNDEYVTPKEMINRLLADNQHIRKAQRNAIDVTDDQNDSATNDLLQAIIDQTERRIWFLFEIAQGLEDVK